MPLFSPADRQQALDEIVAFSKENEHIVALVAVGSGAYGYIDELSDLDFVVAVDDDANTEAVMAYMAAQLRQRLAFVYFKQAPQWHLQVYVSDQYLEIDIGYGTYTRAAAMRKHWMVLFDKSGTVDERMRASWAQQEAAPAGDAYGRALAECADTAWHHLMHAAVAIKRGQPWRAAAELEITRNAYIGLLGSRYKLDTARGRELDRLPAAMLDGLQRTLVASLKADALWQSLDALTEAIYNELEHGGDAACIAVSREHVREYSRACKALAGCETETR